MPCAIGLIGHVALDFARGQREQAAGLAGGELALGDQLLEIRGKLRAAGWR